MKTSILEDQDFLLSVQESWDSYYEVIVQFAKNITAHDYVYHLFVDKKTEKSYYLKPRYIGQDIGNIFIDKQIIVNISKIDSEPDQDENPQLTFYATGTLKWSTT